MNNISLYSLRSNTSKQLNDDGWSLYVREGNIVLNDGSREYVLDPTAISTFSPSSTLFPSPSFDSTAIVERNQTLIQCLNNIFNSVMTLAYYNEYKNELIGPVGPQGPQGIKGDKGEPGKNGLDGKDGEDGEEAKGWIWDLINTGLTAASFVALQAELHALDVKMTTMFATGAAKQVLDDASDLADVALETYNDSTWLSKICKWFKQAYEGITTNRGFIEQVETIVESPSSTAFELFDLVDVPYAPFMVRDIPNINTDFNEWLYATYPQLKTLLSTINTCFTDAGYSIKKDNTDLFTSTVYVMVGELLDNIATVSYDDEPLRALIDTKANKQHKHTLNDINGVRVDYDELDVGIPNTQVYFDAYGMHVKHRQIEGTGQILDARLVDEYDLSERCADKKHQHTIADITDYVAPTPYDDTEVRAMIDTKLNTVPLVVHGTKQGLQYLREHFAEYPDNSIFSFDTPELGQYTTGVMIKSGLYRSICFEMYKYLHKEHNILRVGFVVGDPRYGGCGWRSIPLYDPNSNNISINGALTSTNIKADNDIRLVNVEKILVNKANAVHKHTLADITDYVAPTPYDDTEIRSLIDTKADATHTHTSFSDITVNNINGCSIAQTGSNTAGVSMPYIPVVRGAGVMEVGKYIDMHDTNKQGADYSVRITCNNNNTISVSGGMNVSGINTSGNIKFSDTQNPRMIEFSGGSDCARIMYQSKTKEQGSIEIATADDGNEPIYVRQYKITSGNRYGSVQHEATLLDGQGNTSFPGTLTAANIKADNETRLSTVEANKADTIHKHTLADITDYIAPTPYDDTEVRTMVNNKADKQHKHSLSDIKDAEISVFTDGFTDERKLMLNDIKHVGVLLKEGYEVDVGNDVTDYVPPLYTNLASMVDVDNACMNKADKDHTHSIADIADGVNDSGSAYLNEDSIRIKKKIGGTVTVYSKVATDADITTHTHPISKVEGLQSILDSKATKEHTHKLDDLDKQSLIDLIHPIGSVYTSTDKTDPSILFPGTNWENIHDRFLWCADPLTSDSSTTGGSKQITVDNLPAHSHGTNTQTFHGDASLNNNTGLIWESTGAAQGICNHGREYKPNFIGGSTAHNTRSFALDIDFTVDLGNTHNTGSGTDYMPPYYTVYAWKRVA